MRIFSRSQIGRQPFASVVKADQDESNQNKDAGESIATQYDRCAFKSNDEWNKHVK